jgi:4-hydroxy-tetrahydrodipicolinate synthase
VVGEEMRRMVDEPDRRHEIDQSLQDVYRDLAVAPLACSVKTALSFMGIDVGIPRLPYVELEEYERETIRRLLDRHGLLATAA